MNTVQQRGTGRNGFPIIGVVILLCLVVGTILMQQSPIMEVFVKQSNLVLPEGWNLSWPFDYTPDVCDFVRYHATTNAENVSTNGRTQYFLPTTLNNQLIDGTSWNLRSAIDTLTKYCGWSQSDEALRDQVGGPRMGRYFAPPQ